MMHGTEPGGVQKLKGTSQIQAKESSTQNNLDWELKQHPSYWRETRSIYKGSQALKRPTTVKKKDRAPEEEAS